MDSDGLIPSQELAPDQLASVDQNLAGANNRIDYLLQRLAEHLEAHTDCPGAWCVSEPFADAVMTLDQQQMAIVITTMARRLVELA